MVLVTTAIKETFPENIDEKVLFLGEWCKDYHSKSIWGNRNYIVVDTYLKDREKLYQEVASIRLNISGLPLDKSAKEICNIIANIEAL